jgi:hypothetical protein
MGDDATMPQLALARLRANGDFGEDRGVDLLRLRCFATDRWSDGDSLLVEDGAIMRGIHISILLENEALILIRHFHMTLGEKGAMGFAKFGQIPRTNPYRSVDFTNLCRAVVTNQVATFQLSQRGTMIMGKCTTMARHSHRYQHTLPDEDLFWVLQG